jgi:hypothetical protein
VQPSSLVIEYANGGDIGEQITASHAAAGAGGWDDGISGGMHPRRGMYMSTPPAPQQLKGAWFPAAYNP